jgi:hypothetical protein
VRAELSCVPFAEETRSYAADREECMTMRTEPTPGVSGDGDILALADVAYPALLPKLRC